MRLQATKSSPAYRRQSVHTNFERSNTRDIFPAIYFSACFARWRYPRLAAQRQKAKPTSTPMSFRLGEIEHLPAADNSVDVVISNCVVNLAPDKGQVNKGDCSSRKEIRKLENKGGIWKDRIKGGVFGSFVLIDVSRRLSIARSRCFVSAIAF